MKLLAALFVLFTALVSTAAADVITSKNGQRLEGLITRENEKEIAINVDGLELTMGRNEIQAIEKKPLPKKVKPEPAKEEAASQEPALAPLENPTPADIAAEAAKHPNMPNEFPILVFDQRNWRLGNQGGDENGVIAEFVLENETVQNWSELLSAQMFPGLQSKAMPVDFAYSAKNELLKICPTVDWRLLSASQSEAMYEWSISGCQAQPDQMEIVRAVRGEQGMHVIHYAAKKSKLPDEERLKWIERLGRAKLAKK